MDIYSQAQVIAEVAAPSDGPVADRLPGQSLWLRVFDLPTLPFRARYRLMLSLGEVTDLAQAKVGRPPNVVKQAARMIRLLVDATAAAARPAPRQGHS